LALKAAGYRIELVITKHSSTARRAKRLIGGGTLSLSARQLSRPGRSQHARLNRSALVLIATPDDMIASVAEQLAGIFRSSLAQPRSHKGPSPGIRVAMHTSGALSSRVLHPLRQAGFATGSIHPLVSISDSLCGAKLLTQAYFSLEGDSESRRVGRSVVRDLGGRSFTITAGSKALYHAAALTASPNMVALFDIALEMLGRCGLSAGRARQVLLPLVESTLANLSTQDPRHALTGTFKRGDVATVRKHIAAMESEKLRDAIAAYVLLGRRSLLLAGNRSANDRGLDQIARLLSRAAKTSPRR
jgi:predicted short-subunit dehydrogenase-like oxidoreductase (DUF2520 family)